MGWKSPVTYIQHGLELKNILQQYGLEIPCHEYSPAARLYITCQKYYPAAGLELTCHEYFPGSRRRSRQQPWHISEIPKHPSCTIQMLLFSGSELSGSYQLRESTRSKTGGSHSYFAIGCLGRWASYHWFLWRTVSIQVITTDINLYLFECIIKATMHK